MATRAKKRPKRKKEELRQQQLKKYRKLNSGTSSPPSEGAADSPHPSSAVAQVRNGDSVRVREGVLCPDYESLSLTGWQGRVFESETGDDGKLLVGIHWDSLTLKQIPVQYIARSEEEGLGWTEMYLHFDDIEPAEQRDTDQDAKQVAEEMLRKLYWLGEGKQGERIFVVIANVDTDNEMECFEAWAAHLKKTLKFPFDAEVSESQDKWALDYGDRLTVTGFNRFIDNSYGILVEVDKGEERYTFPLCDLTVVQKKSPNHTPVQDYCVWFANR